VNDIDRNLPELPHQARQRLQQQYGLPDRDIEVLLTIDSEREVLFDGKDPKNQGGPEAGAVAYFDNLCTQQRDPKVVVNWSVLILSRSSSFWSNVGIFRLVHELIGKLSARKESFKVNKISVSQLGQLIDLVEAGTITRSSFYSMIDKLLCRV
jgi:aspartyl-tRNA(Asn)/glutamyl-tRNA(Gln) amidotransferase subunit B